MTADNILMCGICFAMFVTKHALEEHTMSRHSSEAVTADLNHSRDAETKGRSPKAASSESCFKCGTVVSSKNELKKHVLNHFKRQVMVDGLRMVS
jgi:hypothetical protein